MTSVAPDLSENVSKLVELTKQLAEAKSDIKVLDPGRKAPEGERQKAYGGPGY
jgi:hypothetical protein